jgi:hypothetical protein
MSSLRKRDKWEVAKAVPAVAIDEAPQTVEGVVVRDGVFVVVHTISGILPQRPA